MSDALWKELSHYGKKFGVQVDENLYVALSLTLLSKRHSIIESNDIKVTSYEIGLVLNRYWGLNSRLLIATNDTSLDDLLRFFTSNASGIHLVPAFVIMGIENLSIDTQRLILKFIRSKTIEYQGTLYVATELFSIIGIVQDTNRAKLPLDEFLINEFWIRQPHKVQYKLQEDSIIETLYKENEELMNAETIRKFLTMNDQLKKIQLVPDISRYVYDIIIFVRTHRCVHTGLPTRFIKELELISKALCVVFRREFVIPTIVKLGARKLLPLHIKLIPPEHEPSLQWGSDLDLTKELLRRITPEIIVEDVLKKISPPL